LPRRLSGLPRLHLLLRWEGADGFAPAARRYFFDQTGSAWPAATCSRTRSSRRPCAPLPRRGGAFYKGAIAEAIVDAVREAPTTRATSP
jgi:gamma-glutamyltranspeptidase/glutathione hydrolase